MNAFKLTTLLAFALALGLAGTGCKHKPPPVTRFPNGTPNEGVAGNGSPLGTAGTVPSEGIPMGGGEAAPFNPDDMTRDRAALAPQTIYFDYDSSTISAG